MWSTAHLWIGIKNIQLPCFKQKHMLTDFVKTPNFWKKCSKLGVSKSNKMPTASKLTRNALWQYNFHKVYLNKCNSQKVYLNKCDYQNVHLNKCDSPKKSIWTSGIRKKSIRTNAIPKVQYESAIPKKSF